MANHLDLEEQEQLDQLKHFWKQYGNLISIGLIILMSVFATWNGYQYWQRGQSSQAAALFDELESIARSGDVDKAQRAFSEMKSRFGSAIYTQQAGLMVAKLLHESGKTELSTVTLTWVAENASDKGYASVARLRLSAVLMDSKKYDEAIKVLGGEMTPDFLGLASDRRGDIYALQGKKAEAKTEYQKAYREFDEQTEYRRLVEVKLNALGVNPLMVNPVSSVTGQEAK
jgi:predicted negative regulator of RcsB-dependent stress response